MFHLRIYTNKKIDNREYNYKQNIYILRRLFIISLVFFILSVYETEINQNIVQINIDLSKPLIIIDIVCIISTIVLLFFCLSDDNFDEKRKKIEIQLHYFDHLCDNAIYSIEKK